MEDGNAYDQIERVVRKKLLPLLTAVAVPHVAVAADVVQGETERLVMTDLAGEFDSHFRCYDCDCCQVLARKKLNLLRPQDYFQSWSVGLDYYCS